MAQGLGAEYWAVSSKTGDNVEALFLRVAALTFDRSVTLELSSGGSDGRKQSTVSEYSCLGGRKGFMALPFLYVHMWSVLAHRPPCKLKALVHSNTAKFYPYFSSKFLGNSYIRLETCMGILTILIVCPKKEILCVWQSCSSWLPQGRTAISGMV